MENILNKELPSGVKLLVSKEDLINVNFKWFEWNGIKSVRDPEIGLEKCEDDEAEFWSVYGRGYDGLVACVADCDTKDQAVAFCVWCNDILAQQKELIPATTETLNDTNEVPVENLQPVEDLMIYGYKLIEAPEDQNEYGDMYQVLDKNGVDCIGEYVDLQEAIRAINRINNSDDEVIAIEKAQLNSFTDGELQEELERRGYVLDTIWCIDDADQFVNDYNEQNHTTITLSPEELREAVKFGIGCDSVMTDINEFIDQKVIELMDAQIPEE